MTLFFHSSDKGIDCENVELFPELEKAKWWGKLDSSFISEALKKEEKKEKKEEKQEEQNDTCSINTLEDVNKIDAHHKHIWMGDKDGDGLEEDSPDAKNFKNVFADKCFPNIETITISDPVSEVLIVSLVQSCPNITSLEIISYMLTLSFDSFVAIVTNCNKLEILKIEREITVPVHASLDIVRRNCQNLIYFHASRSKIPRQFAKYILHKTQKLRVIRSKDTLYVRPSVTLAELVDQYDEVEDDDFDGGKLFERILIY